MKTPHKQSFFIPGRLPGMNDIISAAKTSFSGGKAYEMRGGGYWVLKRKWESKVIEMIELSEIKPVNMFKSVFKWVEKTKRRDPDNIAAAVKIVFDSLQKAKIIASDGWRHNKGWTNEFITGENCGVEVTITNYNKEVVTEGLTIRGSSVEDYCIINNENIFDALRESLSISPVEMAKRIEISPYKYVSIEKKRNNDLSLGEIALTKKIFPKIDFNKIISEI